MDNRLWYTPIVEWEKQFIPAYHNVDKVHKHNTEGKQLYREGMYRVIAFI